jgi:hypothetical protein
MARCGWWGLPGPSGRTACSAVSATPRVRSAWSVERVWSGITGPRSLGAWPRPAQAIENASCTELWIAAPMTGPRLRRRWYL